MSRVKRRRHLVLFTSLLVPKHQQRQEQQPRLPGVVVDMLQVLPCIVAFFQVDLRDRRQGTSAFAEVTTWQMRN
jgi:hypothetical protein